MIPLKLSAVRAAALLLALGLAACAGQSVRPAAGQGAAGQAEREALLAAREQWSFTGRLAVDTGEHAGNARIEWSQDGEDFEIRLSAPVTRQSWWLRRVGGQVRIEGMDGGVREGSDAEALLRESTGWDLPVDALAAWVRGRRADPAVARLQFDASGLPSVLEEAGWTVEYRAWEPRQPALPVRVFARRDGATVRLAIERWSPP
jgi:outer membrane lipoprotein LolB